MFGDVFLFEFMENRFNFTRLVVKEKFMITWIIEEIVVPLLLVVLLLLNYGEKSGNDFVNSIIFRTFEDRNN